jgi:outer membrane protein assembly factor BamB
MRLPSVCTLAVSVFFAVTSNALAENWPQWRGANHDGISAEKNLPTEWSATKNVVWTAKLPGMGGSTPVVWGERIFLTSETAGTDLVLLCLGTDGKEIWKQKLGTGSKKVRGDEGNWASATPSTDGKHVWAFVGSGELACFDFEGKEVWKFNLQDRYGKFQIQFGMHSTPLLDGDRLYLQLIHDGGAWVIALEKATGKEVWKVERKSDGTGENKHSYASPTIWRKGTEALLITHGADYAIGHRLDNGEEVWRVGGLNPQGRGYRRDLRFVASPAASPDLIVVPSAKDHGVVGMKPDAKGLVEAGSLHELWRMSKNTPDVPSPLIHDGLVYLCQGEGFLIVLEGKTGKEEYSQRIHGSRYRACPVYADGNVYLTARDGVVTVVKAGTKFEKVAENKLPEQISASPAVSNGRIYLRGFETLYAIGAK